jgi:hypothetical protein
MGLGLQSNSHMFDRRAQESVGDAGERSGGVVLAIAEVWFGVFVEVCLLELSPRVMETAELDGYTGADADEWR